MDHAYEERILTKQLSAMIAAGPPTNTDASTWVTDTGHPITSWAILQTLWFMTPIVELTKLLYVMVQLCPYLTLAHLLFHITLLHLNFLISYIVLTFPLISSLFISLPMTITAFLCFSWFFYIKDLKMGKMIFRRPSNDGLYSMNIHHQISTAKSHPFVFLGARVAAQVWHSRLGHPALATISKLLSNKCLPTMGSDSLSFCHVCSLSKNFKLPFQLSNYASNNPLDLINSDVWSSPIASMRDSKYYVYLLMITPDTHGLFLRIIRAKSLVFLSNSKHLLKICFLLKSKPYNLMVVENTLNILFNNFL